MGYLWILTIILSFIMEVTNELRIFKDASDNGYKIDLNRLTELARPFKDRFKPNLLLFLIPVINILVTLKHVMEYNKVRPMFLDQLRVMGALEEMSQEEWEEYAKKPTSLTAFLIANKAFDKKNELFKAQKVHFDDDGSEVVFKFDKDSNDITILKTTGPISKLSPEEQKKMVIEKTKDNTDETKNMIDTADNDQQSVDLNSLDNSKKDEPSLKESTITEQKQELEKLKEELLEEKEKTQESEQKGNKLIKKRK